MLNSSLPTNFMFTCPSAAEMADVHDVAPEGDVTLILGANGDAQTTHIHVSSVVLSLGSPVFKAMLGPHFKEGQVLKSGSQLDLPLPDDDPEIMLLICEVMHMKRVTMDQPNSERLLRLAIVVDKYDCRLALAYFVCTWFQQLPAFGSDLERVNVFFAAFYFKLPEEFARLGRQIVLENSGAINKDDLVHCEPGLENVLGEANFSNWTSRRPLTLETAQLEAQRQCLANAIARAIQKRVMAECGAGDIHNGTCSTGCNYTAIRGTNLIKRLVGMRLWLSDSIMHQSLRETHRRLCALPCDWASDIQCCGGRDSQFCVGQWMPSCDIVAQILERHAETAEHVAISPCLQCVNTGHVQLSGTCERGHKYVALHGSGA